MILSRFFTRINWALQAFSTNSMQPHVQLSSGVILDLANRRIIIPGDFELYTKGNLRLTSDKHIIIKSGCDPEKRDGYVHGVWLNADADQDGNPLLDQETIEVIQDGNKQHSERRSIS